MVSYYSSTWTLFASGDAGSASISRQHRQGLLAQGGGTVGVHKP